MIFVTGATSHTGKRVVRRLLSEAGGEGEPVHCLVRDAARARNILTPFLSTDTAASTSAAPTAVSTTATLPPPEQPIPAEASGRLRLIEGDINDPATYAEALRGARAIINVAHMRHGPALAALAEEAGVRRLVCLSSTRRYTRWLDRAARDVIAAESALERSPIDWTILQAAMIYGGPDDNNVEKLVRLIRRWPVLPLPGGGRNLVQPVFVGDLVEAIVGVLDNPASFRRAYILAGPEPLEYRVMVRVIARALGRRVWVMPVPLAPAVGVTRVIRAMRLPLPIHPDQVRRMGEDKAFDIKEARRDLRFDPRPFAEGLRLKLQGLA